MKTLSKMDTTLHIIFKQITDLKLYKDWHLYNLTAVTEIIDFNLYEERHKLRERKVKTLTRN